MQPALGRVLKPGKQVPETGIYVALHANRHCSLTELVLKNNDKFPWCESCGDRVQFRLVRSAPYIIEDVDFKKPAA
jgi:hypothetical protein